MPVFTDEQQMIAHSATRLLDAAGGVAHARARRVAWPETDRAVWRQMAEMGLFALLLDEDAGGMGATAADLVALLDAIGDRLPPEPLLAAMAVLPLLHACQTPAATKLAEQAAAGNAIVLLAEPAGGVCAAGTTHQVVDAHWADFVLLGVGEGAAFSLRGVARAELGADWAPARLVDGGSLGDVAYQAGLGEELGRGAGVQRAVAAAQQLQRLGSAALLTGLARGALDRALAHLRLREQFGVKIGSFQALQHRAASLHVAWSAARALVFEAARAMRTPQAARAAAMAKARASDMALLVTKEAIQFHGAIGFADEHEIGLYFRRAVALAAQHGTARESRGEIWRAATGYDENYVYAAAI